MIPKDVKCNWASQSLKDAFGITKRVSGLQSSDTHRDKSGDMAAPSFKKLA